MQTVKVRARKGETVNQVVDYIFEQTPNLPDKASTFKLFEDVTTMGGSGAPAYIEVRMTFNEYDEEDTEYVKLVVAFAHSISDQCTVTIISDDIEGDDPDV